MHNYVCLFQTLITDDSVTESSLIHTYILHLIIVYKSLWSSFRVPHILNSLFVDDHDYDDDNFAM